MNGLLDAWKSELIAGRTGTEQKLVTGALPEEDTSNRLAGGDV